MHILKATVGKKLKSEGGGGHMPNPHWHGQQSVGAPRRVEGGSDNRAGAWDASNKSQD